jgi:purine-nucleoside phosphorylase
MPTPHISATRGQFADTVLLPGDPLRARYVAEKHLDDAVLVTAVRNMLGFTGTYAGHRVSVLGSGMGIASSGIYATELIQEYGVGNLIRVGSCGSLQADVELRDIIVGLGAGTDSGVNRARMGGFDFAATADFGLTRATVEAAERLGIPVHVGNVFSSDFFYPPAPEWPLFATLERLGFLGVEMEAAGLYGVAAQFGAKALAVLTVSDHIARGERLSVQEREQSFDDMIRLTLEAVTAL